MSVRSVKMSSDHDGTYSDEEWDYGEDGSDQGSYDSDNSMGDHLDTGHDAGEPSTSAGPEWTVLDTAAIKRLQAKCVEEVVSILGCKHSTAKTVLRHFRWDTEALLTALSEKDPEVVLKQAGACLSSSAGATPGACSSQMCQICYSEVEPSACSTNDCGHSFCSDCWRQHFRVQIGEGQARTIRCMAHKCGVLCDEDMVVALLTAGGAACKEDLDKYCESVTMSYVEDNARVHFCPSVPWCGRAIQADGDPYLEPKCECGKTFCFKCLGEPHTPCTCKMWGMWDEKINGDSETKNWFTANTKHCPKCTKPVEKNGGCNLVTCKCGQAFCWLCGAATGSAHTWTKIEGHSCGRWKDELDKKIDEAQRNHKRYMHYFERFKSHKDSFARESAKREDLEKRIQDKVKTGQESRDYAWLLCALDQLNVARRVLANSYAFAYFFFGGELYKDDFTAEDNKRNQTFFEDLQQRLESEVERLSGLVEGCSETLTIDAEERVKVINSTVSIESRIINFFGMIETDMYGRLQTCSAQFASYRPRRNLIA